MEMALIAGTVSEKPGSEWTPQPMPMTEPDKEAMALMRAVRTGYMLPDDMVRERGFDPETFWDDYAEQMDRIRKKGIVLDIDVSQRTQAGNAVTDPAKAEPATDPDAKESAESKAEE
jgi:capsid protein